MSNTAPKKWLIVPMEIVERELEGKLLICAEAVRRGWGCIIGTKRAVNDAAAHLPNGVVLLKSIIISELPQMQKYKARGHKLACLDEEGLVQNSLSHMVTLRGTAETLEPLDGFLLWGKVQRDAFAEKYPQFAHKFHVVSNPRADVWGKRKYHALYAEEVAAIRARFGDYFIIPTSFGSYNHFMGKAGAMSIYKVDKMITKEDYKFLDDYRRYVKNIYYGFIDLMAPLSAQFRDMNIVVRPHPSENRRPWDALARKFKNVHVTFEGSVTPWLLASKAIIHCGSTTAVEGHLLGVPVISYCRDYNDPNFDLVVPARASINVTDPQEVLKILRGVRAGDDVNAQYPEVAAGHEWLKGWIDNIDSYESAPKIMGALETLGVEAAAYDAVPLPEDATPQATVKERIWDALGFLEFTPVLKDVLPFRIMQAIRSRRYGKSKTKNIDPGHVKAYLERLRVIDGGRAAEVTVLRRNLVVVR